MTKVDELPAVAVDLISGYLDEKALRSASLSIRGWSQAYKRRSCETVVVDLSTPSNQSKLKKLHRWESLDLLKWVRHLEIDDTGVRSQDGQYMLEQLLEYWLPSMTGLKSILWACSRKPELGEPKFHMLPAGLLLDVVCEGDTPPRTVIDVLRATKECERLRRLAIEFPAVADDTLSLLLKQILLGCRHLTALKVQVNRSSSMPEDSKSQLDGEDTSRLHWSVEEASKLPALRDLDLHHFPISEECFAMWAIHGDWTKLQHLTAHHDWILEHLSARVPALESLSVRPSPSLPRFLELQPRLQHLLILEPEPTNNENVDMTSLSDLFTLPFAAELRRLQVQPSHIHGDIDVMKHDLGELATSCPKLESLDITISREQYKNAVNFFCWMDSYIQAIIRMPRLSRLTLRLPRVIAPGTVESPVEIAMVDAAAQLGSQVASHGKDLEEIRIIASMVNEVLPPDFTDRYNAVIRVLASSNHALTFIARAPEKDWDARPGAFVPHCPELEQAEAELLRGRLSRISPSGEYTSARRVVDDMSTLVYKGTIVPKRKIRPMPVWLTPEQEQDRREGPPGPGRRAKRAVLGAYNGFTGAFRPPFTETSPRSAQENQAREVGFGGRPGWSKSSFASRLVWR